jgi:spermidine dehydrogenase
MADRPDISRRDFLNGVALSVAAGTSLSPLELLAAQQPAGTARYYPPLLAGLRGNHPGSFEVAHSVALAGAKYAYPAEQTDPTYDLVVVGGGISGLASAWLYRERTGPDRKILVLDNHDDFGGHAKRNEFVFGSRTLIGYGGSQSMETPGRYSKQAHELIERLGIVTERFYRYFDRDFTRRHGLEGAIHFSANSYGADRTLRYALGGYYGGVAAGELERVIAGYPISDDARSSLLRLLREQRDYLAGMSHEQKIALLRSTSYSDFLRKHAGVDNEAVTLLRDTVTSYWGVGWDVLSALEAYRLGEPGTANLGIDVPTEAEALREEPYIFHFPDGNASIARSLVRKLVPEAMPGETMEDLVLAQADYAKLDVASSATRIRLNAPVLSLRHTPDQSHVDVVCMRGGRLERVRARHVVLACYHQMIPHIVADMPEAQRDAIHYAVKTPLVYINIAIRNWQAFAELGFRHVYVPQGELMHSFGLDFPVSMGGYAFTSSPHEPAILHGVFVPTTPDVGLTHKEQLLRGQHRLYEMSFDDYETAILRQLDAALAGGGFNAGRDVSALTVNRWPHGYAYEYNELFDPPGYDREHGPHVTARARIGRMSIANSDASAAAYADGAIDAAYRAVGEQLAL